MAVWQVLFLAAAATAAPAAPGDAAAEVRALIATQAAEWNRGDIDAFVSHYARTPEFRFFGGGDVVDSAEKLAARYRKRYQNADPADFGTLDFRDVDIVVAGPDAALARGRYRVSHKGKVQQGLFTILVRKVGTDWRIVHDHSSEGKAE